MLRFVVLSFFLSFCCCANSQNATQSASAVSAPNFDSPSIFQVTQPVDHSEGPMWDGRKNILYFVDIYSGRVLSYNYDTKKVNFITLKGAVTPVIPSKKNENVLIVGVDRSLVALEWDGEKELGNQREDFVTDPCYQLKKLHTNTVKEAKEQIKHAKTEFRNKKFTETSENIRKTSSVINHIIHCKDKDKDSIESLLVESEKVPSFETLTTVSQQFPKSRFNDGKADRHGRVWIGTMGYENPTTRELDPNQGILYKMTRDTLISPLVEVAPVNISNGISWNKANNKMYYIDSPTRKVIEYDYNDEKGDISNPRVAIDITKFPSVTGNPDGMTIDQDDNLWIALYYGGAVIRANPRNGQLLQVVPIPARDVTSVSWGGPNLDILFVTTSRFHLNEDQRKVYPAAGSVFAVTNLKQKGVPPYYADLVDSVRRANILAEILLNTNELFAPSPSNEVVSYPPASSNQEKKAKSQEKEDVPFWMAMINTLRSIF